jgi:predicted transcriptional regulator of viral defense system
MQTITEKLMQSGLGHRVVSQAQLGRLVDGTPQRRYNLINRAVKHGELLHLRRGFYLLAPNLQTSLPHPYVLAQVLQPGSYISLETALSFHGWIPESVPTTLSVLPGRRQIRVDHPLLGRYRFYSLAFRRGQFLQAVDRHTFSGQTALVAKPLRALLDIVCLRKYNVTDTKTLVASMRIDQDMFDSVDPATWELMRHVYLHKRINESIQALQREVGK